jgi:hypothetical protein
MKDMNLAAKCAFFIIAELCHLALRRLLVWSLRISLPMLTASNDNWDCGDGNKSEINMYVFGERVER